jgi:hypothetical protein
MISPTLTDDGTVKPEPVCVFNVANTEMIEFHCDASMLLPTETDGIKVDVCPYPRVPKPMPIKAASFEDASPSLRYASEGDFGPLTPM